MPHFRRPDLKILNGKERRVEDGRYRVREV
jgi:hypothetical protein